MLGSDGVISLDLPTLLAAGAALLALGLAVYAAYRRRHGVSPEKSRTQALEPLGVEEVEYQSIMVAFGEHAFDEQSVATAKTLAAPKHRAIHVIALVEVPSHLPFGTALEAKEAEAQSKIERAKLIAGGRVSGKVVRVRPGQAGAAVIDGARAAQATALVMPLRYRAGAPVYSKTLQTVLAKRPCRVIVSASPESARAGIAASLPS